ncbi:MAG: beta-lactamase family protein [Acidobacteria bacterium]|nr:beta-lactamase family protein [Acidobacteriota bacterium]
MMRASLVVLGTTLLAATLAGQRPLPESPPAAIGLDPDALAEATALLEQFVVDGRIAGGVAAIARRGHVGYLKAVGVQDRTSKAPMTERSLFRIYSMTKAVTAVAVMMLHDEGRFRLDDPVSKYLPEFAGVKVVDTPGATPRPPARPVTVEDLLLHTSGLSHRTSDLYRALGVRSRSDTLPEFVGKITRAPLMEDPHTRFRYSEATTVLGRLVEVWSGEAFDRFLSRRVFGPLGMTDTGFWVEGERRGRLATAYGPAPDGGLAPVDLEAVPFTERPALLEGAVGLVSSVPDFLRFSQMLLDKGTFNGRRLLKADTAQRMTVNGLPADVLKARGGRMGWGLANVNVVMDAGGSTASLGEYGWDGTAGTIFWNDPAKETVVVLMTQSSPANPDGLRQKFKAIADRAIR